MNQINILPILQTILAICNIAIIGYGFYKFLNKPHDSLEAKHEELKKKVEAHDVEINDIKQALRQGNDKFRDQDEAISVLIKSTLALIEFEMQYCLLEHKDMSSGLAKAKEELNNYLSK